MILRQAPGYLVAGLVLLLLSCKPKDPSAPATSLSEPTGSVAMAEAPVTNEAASVQDEETHPYQQRIEKIERMERVPGQTLITGESLIFDYERRFVRMEEQVTVTDDQGRLYADTLTGRFSADNKVELIEARRGVRIESADRTAKADEAIYEPETGAIQLIGQAEVTQGGNRLKGQEIRFWIQGSRRMICEPEALLELTAGSELGVETGGSEGDIMSIRSDRMVYEEKQQVVNLQGNVRVRDARGGLDCEQVRIFLKENNELDWIEASNGVIIQSDGRRALAEQAFYYADEGRYVLEGNPRIRVDRHIMTGDRIEFWQDSEAMRCEPNARVLLYPDDEMKAGFLQEMKD